MNKKLAGAYINFKSVPQPKGTVGSRGVATMPLPLSWGPEGELIKVLSSDLEDGKSLSRVGFTAFDADSLVLRQCLMHCYKLLLWRLDTGGQKAKATIGGLTITAKYTGVKGNNLLVAVVGGGSAYDVVTYYNHAEQDRQTVSSIAGLAGNAWVDFSGTGELEETVGTPLAGGADGTVTSDAYTAYLEAMRTEDWQTMGIVSEDKTLPPIITSYIKGLRDNAGKKVQAVVYNDNSADHEGIISCKQGYEIWGTDDEGNETLEMAVSPVNFVAWVTGATAGAAVNESLCYKAVEGATRIINPLAEDALEEEIAKGWFLLGKRVDGVIVVQDDLNTFVSHEPEKDEDFGNNRVIRTLDEIAMTTQLQFEKMFIGRVDNDASGRDALKGQVIANLRSLQDIRAITNLAAEDIEVLAGPGKPDVIVNGYIQPVDCMKKLYMTIFER